MPSRPRSALPAAIVLAAALLAMAAAGGAPARTPACRYAKLKPRSSNLAKVRSAVRCLVNRERTRRGLAALRASAPLAKAAQRHSVRMVRGRFFEHDGPDGTPRSRVRAAGYDGRRIGENIAWGSGSYSTAGATVSNWMHSPPHRGNILDRHFKDTGVGVAVGSPEGGPGATYTQTFGGD